MILSEPFIPYLFVVWTDAADTCRVGVSVVSFSPVQAATGRGDSCADDRSKSLRGPGSVRLGPGGASTRVDHRGAY